MSRYFVFGFVALGLAGCGEGGPGPDNFIEFRQAPPRNGVQLPPENGAHNGTPSQAPAFDPQAPYYAEEAPPAQQVRPAPSGAQRLTCEAYCGAIAACGEPWGPASHCVERCTSGLAEDVVCARPWAAYMQCVANELRCEDVNVTERSYRVPTGCIGYVEAALACSELYGSDG
jgi:hypothetical protein